MDTFTVHTSVLVRWRLGTGYVRDSLSNNNRNKYYYTRTYNINISHSSVCFAFVSVYLQHAARQYHITGQFTVMAVCGGHRRGRRGPVNNISGLFPRNARHSDFPTEILLPMPDVKLIFHANKDGIDLSPNKKR